jgi:hypothetical protein
MTAEAESFPDPLIDEVRQRRRQIWDECGQDFDKLLERIQRLQAEHPEKLVDPRKSRKASTNE